MTDCYDETLLLPAVKPVLEKLQNSPQKIDQVFIRSDLDNPSVKEIEKLCRLHSIRCTRVPLALLDRLTRRKGSHTGIAHQGVLARLTAAEFTSLESLLCDMKNAPLKLILALDQVQDSGNLGTLARTLYTLGGAGIIVPAHKSASLGPGVRKSSAGAIDLLPIARVANLGIALDSCEEEGFTIYGTQARNPKARNAFLESFQLPAVLVLGNEQKGIQPFIAKRCHFDLVIPTARDFDSFNVAQAGALLMGLMAAQNYRM